MQREKNRESMEERLKVRFDPVGDSNIEVSEPVRFISLRGFLLGFVGAAVLLLGLGWLLLDEQLQQRILTWTSTTKENRAAYGFMVMGVLASDLVLPVPSSTLLTHAGIQLGWVGGTAIGSVGLTLGSVIGFGLARLWGQRFVAGRIRLADQELLETMSRNWGRYVVVLLRPVPILAEASVLLLGVGGMDWRAFATWLGLSNFSVALVFVGLGAWGKQSDWGEFPALLLATLIPVILLLIVRLTHYDSFRKNMA